MIHRFGACEFDEHRFELRRAGRPVPLQPRCLDLLACFLRHRGRLLRHDELIREVWRGTVVSRSAIAFAVSSLRSALADDGALVVTVHGRGYRFAAEAEIEPTRETPASEPEPAREPAAASGRRAGAPGASVARESAARAPVARARDAAAPAERATRAFVGRARELGELAAALDDALAGRRSLSLVTGEPGIGKTRLVKEHAARARERGAAVLLGACSEDEAAPDFWPWVEIVRGALALGADVKVPAELRGWAERGGLAAAVLDAEGPEQLPGSAEDRALGASRFRLFDAIARLLADTARSRPLVVVIEDLHAADPASLRLLELLACSGREAALSLVVTCRTPSRQTSPRLVETIAGLLRDPRARVLEVGPLSRAEVAAFVEVTFGPEAGDDVTDAICARTEGQPLFVVAALRVLAREGGRLTGPDGLTIAGGVREAIRAGLARRSPACRTLLEAASVLGRELGRGLLHALLDDRDEDLLAALDEALDTRVLEPAGPDRVRFSHGLVREVLYEGIPLPRRAELHARAADALEAGLAMGGRERSAERARHLLLAGPLADAKRVVEAFDTAARRAAGALAFESALAHYEQAIAVLEERAPHDAETLADLLLAQGRLALRTGDAGRARAISERLVALARALGSAERLAHAALLDPGSDSPSILPTERVALLEEALEGISPAASALRIELLARLANLLHFSDDQERRARAAGEALALARALGERDPLARALVARHLLLWTPAHVDERLAIAGEVEALARRADDPALRAWSHQARATAWLEKGDALAHRREVDALRRLLARVPAPLLPSYRCWLAVVEGMLAFLGGRFAEAEAHAGEAARLRRFDGGEASEKWIGLLLYSIRREQGRLAELDPMLRMLVRQEAPLPAWQASAVLLHAACGRTAQAREELALLLELASHARRDYTWLPTRASIAQVLALGGDPDRARALLAELAPFADRVLALAHGVGSMGSVARHLGLLSASLGDLDAAERHFEDALEIEARWGAEVWLAHVRCALGSVLLARGRARDRARARQLLADGRAAARAIGMAPLVALAELAERRVPRPARSPRSPARSPLTKP